MALTDQFKLTDYLAPWTPNAVANRDGMGDGWNIALEFTALHLDALESMANTAAKNPSDQQQALILIASHVFNLYAASLRLITHGQFDIASYLLRGLIDGQGIFYAITKEPDFAAKFLNDELKGSVARKFVVENLKRTGDSTADVLDARWSVDADAANTLAHACVVHADKLVEANNGSITPVLCGKADQQESGRMALAAHEYEAWLLTWFREFHSAHLPNDWTNRFGEAQKVFGPWAKAVGGSSP